MEPIKDFDKVDPKGNGDYIPLQLGGHICIIKNASETETTTFKKQIVLELDILEGEQAEYFQKIFDNDNRLDSKWPCMYRQLTIDSPEYFKGMITAIENSNDGYSWDWDEKKLIGKKVGGVFGLEEYYNQDGEIKIVTKCVRLRSTDKVIDAQIPKVKLSDGSMIDYEDYIAYKKSKSIDEPNKDIKEFVDKNLVI